MRKQKKSEKTAQNLSHFFWSYKTKQNFSMKEFNFQKSFAIFLYDNIIYSILDNVIQSNKKQVIFRDKAFMKLSSYSNLPLIVGRFCYNESFVLDNRLRTMFDLYLFKIKNLQFLKRARYIIFRLIYCKLRTYQSTL